jgi:hypothetical protein
MSHAFFLVMGGFVWEDEHSILYPIIADDLYDEYTDEGFKTPKLIRTDSLRIPLYNCPSSGARPEVISGSLAIAPHGGLAASRAGPDFADEIPLINSYNDTPTNNGSIIPLIDLIAHISEEDIVDKSAGDGLSKLIAMVQVIWFVTQLIGRRVMRITITELEVVTAGYAVMNLAIYMLCWSKPLRVNQPIILYSLRVQDIDRAPSHMPRIADRSHTSAAQFIEGAWQSILGGQDESSIRGKVGLLWAGMSADGTLKVIGMSLVLASVFGGIHLAAWNFRFLSLLEMWLWRSTSLAITAIPLLMIPVLIFGLDWAAARRLVCGFEIVVGYVMTIAQFLLFVILPILYVLCRIVLLVLPLFQLRSLPPSAFLIVPWSTFIPHI